MATTGSGTEAAVAGELAAAQRRLYAVFGRVPRPRRLEGCPHCVRAADEKCLLDSPLPAIEAVALAGYAAKALTTWGGVAELRYFVPRLVECAVSGDADFPDPEIVFGKLALGGWRGWPGEESAAIEEFLTAWWEATLGVYPSRPTVGTVLGALAATGVDLVPFLRRWGRLDGETEVRHLRELLTVEVRWNPGPRLASAFLDRSGAAAGTLLSWLTGGAVAAAVRGAVERVAAEPVLDALADIEPLLPLLEPVRAVELVRAVEPEPVDRAGACPCGHSTRAAPRNRAEALALVLHATEIEPLLVTVGEDPARWLDVLTCRSCGRHWARDSITSGHADLFFVYPIETADPRAWLAAAQPLNPPSS